MLLKGNDFYVLYALIIGLIFLLFYFIRKLHIDKNVFLFTILTVNVQIKKSKIKWLINK